jgi:hypothetical protein
VGNASNQRRREQEEIKMNDIQIQILKEAASLPKDKYGNCGIVWAKWERGSQNLKLPCLEEKPYSNIKSEIVAPLLEKYFEQTDTKGELFRLSALGMRTIEELEKRKMEQSANEEEER